MDKTDISALVTFITNNAGNNIGDAKKIEELQWNAVDKKIHSSF